MELYQDAARRLLCSEAARAALPLLVAVQVPVGAQRPRVPVEAEVPRELVLQVIAQPRVLPLRVGVDGGDGEERSAGRDALVHGHVVLRLSSGRSVAVNHVGYCTT